MLPNSVRKTIHIISERLFDVWWDWYYRLFNSAPRKHYEEEGDEWMLKHWDEKPHDPICFPLPFKINCLGCTGCKHVLNPPLKQDVPKGPYQIFFHPFFLDQHEGMFGKQATFDLVNEMRQKNEEVELVRNPEEEEEEADC